jgi:thymidylate kinase
MNNCRLPTLVHFFGPDGAGKSTHVEILIDLFKKDEPRVKKIWVRSPHTAAFLLWRLLVRIGFFRVVSNPFGDAIRLPAVDRRRSLRTIWALAEFFSVLPLLLRIRFWISRGYRCVAERYVLDTAVTIAFFIGDLNFLRGRISKLLFTFLPADTVFIFLDSDFGTVFNRRAPLRHRANCQQGERDYGSLPKTAVEPREFIDFQRTAYKVLANYFSAIKIDTSKHSIQETSEKIREELRKRVCSSKPNTSVETRGRGASSKSPT